MSQRGGGGEHDSRYRLEGGRWKGKKKEGQCEVLGNPLAQLKPPPHLPQFLYLRSGVLPISASPLVWQPHQHR